jgi:hypothetical protein
VNDLCRVLLICDDDLGGLELRRLLGSELRIDPALGQGEPRVLALEIEEVVLSGTWEIGVRDRQYQLCIVAAGGASPIADLARNPALRASLGAVLFLVESGVGGEGGVSLRPGCDRVLVAPFTRSALLHEVERLLLGVLSRRIPPIGDERYLHLLRALVGDGERAVTPLLVADDLHGSRYPQVLRHFGLGVGQGAVMERLVEHGLCTRAIAQRVRACPACSSHQLVYGEACARCGAVDFVRETMVHHFACAHMDTLQNFRQGEALVCPKCHKTLHQIGRDYEKPADCYQCRACSFISAETRIQGRCLACQAATVPEQTVERLIYAYELTPKADEAVAAGDIGGHGMATVLRSRESGLFAKSFFLFALQRELDRLRRYSAPVSLVLVRSTRLEDIRSEGLARYSDYVQEMWRAATTGLRTLDIPCVWSEGVLAIMLPGTPLAGAEVVSQRIADGFAHAVEPSTPGTDRELVIGCIEASPDHKEAEMLVQDGLGTLAPRDTTASDVLVVEDETAVGSSVPQP